MSEPESSAESPPSPEGSPGRTGPDCGCTNRDLLLLLVACAILFAVALIPASWLGRWDGAVGMSAMLLLPLAFSARRKSLLTFSPRAFLIGVLEGLAAAAVLIPFFFLVVWAFWRFKGGDVGAEKVSREAMFQIAVVAVPEEFFFRAFFQTGLERFAKRKANLLGARLGWGWLVATALFALAHLPACSQPTALLVFIPGLAFGWLWARRRSLAGPVIFHALCNVSLLWVAPGVF